MSAMLDYFHEAVETKKDIDNLKKLILQFAIQGKLVEQDPHDEAASGLLMNIDKVREQLIRDKKIKKEIITPITDDELAKRTIPRGWELVRIGQIMNPVNGIAFKPTDWSNKGLPIIRIQNLNNLNAPFNFCDFEVDKKFIVNSGDLLIGWSGTPGTSFGAFIWNRGKAVLNQHIFKADMYGEYLNKEYVMYSINANLDYMISKAQGAVGLQHITRGKFLDIILNIPPINEQNRIVKKIQELFEKLNDLSIEIDENKKKSDLFNKIAFNKIQDYTIPSQVDNIRFIIKTFEHLCNDKANIDRLRHSLLNIAIQGKLLPQNPNDEPASVVLEKIRVEKERLIKEKKIKKEKPLPPIVEDEIPFNLPRGWQWVRLGELVDERGITYGIVLPGKEEPIDGVKMLRCSNVKFRFIDTSNIRTVTSNISNGYKRTILAGGELLMNIRGTLGGCAIVPHEFAGYNIAREIAMIPLFPFINNKYLLNVISSPYIQNRTSDTLRGIAYKGLNLDLLSKFLIPLPPIAEQMRINERIDQLMTLCDGLEKTVEQSKNDREMLMQAVIQEAFRTPIDKATDFSVPSDDEIGYWEIAARADSGIDAATQTKISNRVSELLGKTHK